MELTVAYSNGFLTHFIVTDDDKVVGEIIRYNDEGEEYLMDVFVAQINKQRDIQ